MGKRILVIDDDTDILEVLELMLTQEGYEIIARQTGGYAEDFVALDPQLVLLDVRIKGYPRSGVEICREFKSSSLFGSIPVLLLSSEHNLPELAEKSGCDGYISKPFEMMALLGKLNSFLNTGEHGK